MNGRWKYVVVPGPAGSWAILVPCCITHRDAINLLEIKPVSAGFVIFEDGNITVEGESDTLKLKSRPEDVPIIKMTLFMAGSAKQLQTA